MNDHYALWALAVRADSEQTIIYAWIMTNYSTPCVRGHALTRDVSDTKWHSIPTYVPRPRSKLFHSASNCSSYYRTMNEAPVDIFHLQFDDTFISNNISQRIDSYVLFSPQMPDTTTQNYLFRQVREVLINVILAENSFEDVLVHEFSDDFHIPNCWLHLILDSFRSPNVARRMTSSSYITSQKTKK